MISSVDYLRVGDVKSLLPQLHNVHKKRVADDKDFREMVEDINEYIANNDKTTVSLNFEKRKAVREKREQKLIDRENARLEALGLEKIIDSEFQAQHPVARSPDQAHHQQQQGQGPRKADFAAGIVVAGKHSGIL